MPIKADNATYNDDGTLTINVCEDGTPVITAIMPAPFSTEDERQKDHEHNIDHIAYSGYYLIYTKRIRNEAFDRKDQKTSWEYRYRPPKNKDEALAVYTNITRILVKRKALKAEALIEPVTITVTKVEDEPGCPTK